MEVLQGEGSGVVVALFGFGDILGEEIVGQVAVDARGQGWWLAFCQESN